MQTRGSAARGMAAQGPARGRVRAFTSEDAEARVARHVTGLAIFLARPDALARALRAMRKAAVRGGAGYDPAYHAALLRLARSGTGDPGKAGRGAACGRGKGGPGDDCRGCEVT